MKSPSTSIRDKGFSIIEIIIALGIIGMIAAFGIIAGIDTYTRYNFRREADTIVSILQKARSESINNIGGRKHGVYFADSDNLILFRTKTDYAGRENGYDLEISKAKSAAYSNTCGLNQIIFSQLSGQTAGCAVTLTENIKSATITINDEGGINY